MVFHLRTGKYSVWSWDSDDKNSGSQRPGRQGLPHAFVLLSRTKSGQSAPQARAIAVSDAIRPDIESIERGVVLASRLVALLLCVGFWIAVINLAS